MKTPERFASAGWKVRSLSRGRLLIAAAAVVLVGALLAAYATLSGDPATESTSQAASIEGAFPLELGPDPAPGQWMGESATLRAWGNGAIWIGFSAASLRRPRSLRIAANGFRRTVRVTTSTGRFLVGPLPAAGQRSIRLSVSPGAQRASRRDSRRLSVFLSDVRSVSRPAYASLDKGFFPRERPRGGRPFNWMGDAGRIETVVESSVAPRAWLSFSAVSRGRPRMIVVRQVGQGVVRRTDVPADAPRTLTLGPFDVHRDDPAFILRTLPGAQRLGPQDARVGSVLVRDLTLQIREPSKEAGTEQGLLILVSFSLAVGALGLVAGRGRPEQSALGAVAFAAPLEIYRTPVAGANLSIFRLVLGGAIVVTLVREWRTLARLLRSPPVVAYGLLAACLAASALAFSAEPEFAGRLLAQVLIGVAAAGVTAALTRRTGVAYLCSVIAFGSLLPMLAATWQAFAPLFDLTPSLPLVSQLPLAFGLEVTRTEMAQLGDDVTRLRGTFGDPNHFGLYLAIVSLLVAGLALRSGAERRPAQAGAWAMFCASGCVFLVASYSRSALLALLVGAVVLGALMRPVRRSVPGLVLVGPRRARRAIVLTVALVLLLPLAPTVGARLLPTSEVNDVSNEGHGSTIRAAAETFADHPVAGVGVGDLGRELDQSSRSSGAHSTYMTVAAELGAVGLLLLLVAAATTLRLVWVSLGSRLPTASAILPIAIAGAFAGFLTANVVYDVWWDDFNWLLLGAALALGLRGPDDALVAT